MQTLTSHPLSDHDREAVAALRIAAASHQGAFDGPAGRAPFDELMERTPHAAGVAYRAGAVGGVPGVWCRPRDRREGAAILYLHGGAYVLGSAHAFRHLAGQLAARTRAEVFVPEYRLAPEHRFPAAVEDAARAYRGLAASAKRIVIAGDSAGGGLALVALSLAHGEARAGRGLAPAGAVVMSPATDLALTAPSLDARAGIDPILTKGLLQAAAASYLAGQDPRDPRASPLHGALAGLPPIQLHVGTDEILFDDTLRHAERARAAGVDATVHVWDGMTHVFPASAGTFDAASEALDVMAAFAGERFGIPPDDPARRLAVVDPEHPALPHVAIAGNTYTILLSGADTAGRYCLIDMHVPACGGPGPHRHDFEEMFTILEGEIQFTFRGQPRVVKAGMTVNIPANAPHFFTNVSGQRSRMLCMCSPAGQDEFFLAIGKAVAARTTVVAKPAGDEMKAFLARAQAIAPRYRTELLVPDWTHPPPDRRARPVLAVMGVSGSGKTTVGSLLAGRLGWAYADADDFHPDANIAKMAAGQPLTDEDRAPWLAAIAAWIDQRIARREAGVVTCSALKRSYRDVLRRPEVEFVYLEGSHELIARRLAARHSHFFKAELLASQLADLEPPAPDEAAIRVPIEGMPAEIVDAVLAATGLAAGMPGMDDDLDGRDPSARA